ncbi:hypothetical protein ACET3Z_026668 [Daucus carota]
MQAILFASTQEPGVGNGCSKGHHGPVHRVRFVPLGESYTCGSEDRSTRVWQTGPSSQEHDSSVANGPDSRRGSKGHHRRGFPEGGEYSYQ